MVKTPLRTLVAMPAYNESKVISQTILQVKKEGFKNILVVDDCSKDNTYEVIKRTEVEVLRLGVNRGPGGATNMCIRYAKEHNFDRLVLIDSDGQHNPKEIKKLLKTMDDTHSDVVIGSRLIGNNKEMPLQRKIANYIGSCMTRIFFGVFVWDSQSGFKVFNKKAIQSIQLTFDRYEFCSEILGECRRNNLTIKEVEIQTIYTDHSLNKGHGQNIFNGITMIIRFLLK